MEGRAMKTRHRFLGIAIGIATLSLVSCADQPGAFDDGTLVSGKQLWEAKRHADDWAQPIVDGMLAFAGNILVQGLESCLDDENAHDSESHAARSKEEWQYIPVHRPTPPTAQKLGPFPPSQFTKS
jgi:hypothetical protein